MEFYPEDQWRKEFPKYRHCSLKRGNERQVSWIPEEFAVVGKILSLKSGDSWSEGWEVVSASELHGGEYVETVLSREHQFWRKK